ncbi:MAG: hypothetical protein AABX66_00015 [Nanoarchaeota archaeon]
MEEKILHLFTSANKLKFIDIERALKQRSNKIAYHLNSLKNRGILKKENSLYSLSDEAEYLIPYLSEKKSSLPVILIEIKKNAKVFLYKRKKRPYLNLYSLPGGRLIIGESVQEGAKRIMLSKFNIQIIPKEIKSISLEHIKKNKIIHSFILILVKAEIISSSNRSIEFQDLNKIKKEVIKSDYKLLISKPQPYNLKTIISNI